MSQPDSSLDGDQAQTPPSAVPGLRVLQVNLRYSHFGFTMLQQFLQFNPIDVILLQDPPQAILSGQGFLPGYNFIISSNFDSLDHSRRPLSAIILRSSLHFQRLPPVHRRLSGALISTGRGHLAVLSAYIRHGDGEGISDLSVLVSSARAHTPLILIGADCNGHSSWWGPPETTTNTVGAQVEDFILQERLSVANRWPSPPTFNSEMGFQTWIDITLTSSPLASSVTDWRVLPDVYLDSDHSALTYTLKLSPDRSTETRLDWRHVPWDEFSRTLQSKIHPSLSTLAAIQTTSDLDARATELTTAFQTTIEAHVPLKRVGPVSNPWWSPHLTELRKAHLRARRRWKRTLTPEDRRTLNISKRTLRNAIIAAKRRCWRDFCENTSPVDMWSAFKKVSRPPSSRIVQPIAQGTTLHYSDVSQATILADRFFSPPSGSMTAFHRTIQSDVDSLLRRIQSAPPTPVTLTEIQQVIAMSGPWKAPGRDGIPFICFRQCESALLHILQHLFTASLRLGHVPASWKVATVVAVPKPGGDPLSPKGYRPISLLPTLSKLLERIIADRLSYYLETHHLLAPTQYGFRQGKSTEDALWSLVSAASTALQTRHRLTLVSLDIQGAYDTVWHTGLVWKLSSLSVPVDLIRWIAAYLSSRMAHVRVRSAEVLRHLTMGVPQGSPLSAILFIVYVNDLLLQLSSLQGTSAQAFADDLSSWWLESAQSSSPSPGPQISQTIQIWASQWRMVFNPAKCQLLSIGRIRLPPPVFQISGVQLACVPHLRYLGVWLDTTLSWREHIRRVSQRALVRLRLIHRGAGTLWGFHPTIFRRLVEAVVFPTLFYAAPVWCTAVRHLSHLAPLDRVIRHSAIASFGLLRTVSHSASQMMAGFLPAEFQLRRRAVEYYLRRLTYGEDLTTPDTPSPLNRVVSPRDIVVHELRQLDRLSSTPASTFSAVDSHHLWLTDPASNPVTFTPSILDRESAMDQIRTARSASSAADLWVFTDGSVEGLRCGAAALLFRGSEATPQTFTIGFSGPHSSTQAELAALLLGCRRASLAGPSSSITFVSDSQAALRSLSQTRRTLALTARVRVALLALMTSTPTVRLWWTPAHSSLRENELADAAAKAAAQGARPPDEVIPVPTCRSSLRTILHRHYVARLETQWHQATTGRDLRAVMPRFSRCLRWTRGLSRRQVTLTAQFLTGHYATQAYLHRFGSRADPQCRWCDAPVDDRHHRLFQCPRFDALRQHLTLTIDSDSHGEQGWTWTYLTGRGRCYLARFLVPVSDAMIPAQVADDSDSE